MKFNLTRLVILLLLPTFAGCVVGNVRQDDPVAVRMSELEQRVAQMERVLKNQSLIDLQKQVDQLQTDVRELRGELESTGNDVDGIRNRQRDVYADIDRRLQALESSTADVADKTAAAASSQDRDAYQAAFALLRDSRYPEAQKAFQDFVQKNPGSSLLPSALYWLARINYVNRDFAKAITQFQEVVQKYPEASKTPEAMLHIGYCQYELKQWADARQTLTAVHDRYPDNPVSKQASDRLDRMTKEGH